MANQNTRPILLAGVALVLAIATVVYWISRPAADEQGKAASADKKKSNLIRDLPEHKSSDPKQPLGTGPAKEISPKSPGFVDEAEHRGIEFRMAFLPGEQGENFKINLYDHGCGAVVGDFNGDGHDDLYLLNQLGPNALYKNDGQGKFVDVTSSAGVALEDRICVAGTFADYDNDGDQDLFVTSTRGGNVLFQNQGNETFKDVTAQAGLTLVAHSQTAAFFDFDNDGFLDLFVTNSARWTTESFDDEGKYYRGLERFQQLLECTKEFNNFYRNNRDGTFADITEKAGLKGQGWGGDVVVFDYDEDGHVDLLVTNMFGQSQVYHNDQKGSFSDVTDSALGQTSWGAIGSKAFDYNNDGKLDIFIADMHSDMWIPVEDSEDISAFIVREHKKKYRLVSGPRSTADPRWIDMEKQYAEMINLQYDKVLFGNTMFKNLGGGKFEEVSGPADVETWWPWGVATADFDNDGFEDIFLPSGMGYPYVYWHNYLLMNNGNGTFTDRSRSQGLDPPARGIYLEEKIGNRRATRSSRCAAVCDFDQDGRLDLLVNNFNDSAYLLRNNFPTKNFIAFRLKGTRSNPDAIGAVVRLQLGNETMIRQVHAAGGYLSQSSKTVHFGLGDRPNVDHAMIRWPSGREQRIETPAINKMHDVVEPQE